MPDVIENAVPLTPDKPSPEKQPRKPLTWLQVKAIAALGSVGDTPTRDQLICRIIEDGVIDDSQPTAASRCNVKCAPPPRPGSLDLPGRPKGATCLSGDELRAMPFDVREQFVKAQLQDLETAREQARIEAATAPQGDWVCVIPGKLRWRQYRDYIGEESAMRKIAEANPGLVVIPAALLSHIQRLEAGVGPSGGWEGK